MEERYSREAVEQANRAIVAALQEHGVIDVHWFRAYYGEPVLWLVTATDLQREAVARSGCFRDVVLPLLGEFGVPSDLLKDACVTVESNETVDRDWNGNWFHAMK